MRLLGRINEDAIDDDLGAFVPTKHDESADADTLTGRKAATDAEVLEDESDPWEGPFPEVDKYDHPTGEDYVRCRDCGRESLTGRKEYATHKEGCRFGGDH